MVRKRHYFPVGSQHGRFIFCIFCKKPQFLCFLSGNGRILVVLCKNFTVASQLGRIYISNNMHKKVVFSCILPYYIPPRSHVLRVFFVLIRDFFVNLRRTAKKPRSFFADPRRNLKPMWIEFHRNLFFSCLFSNKFMGRSCFYPDDSLYRIDSSLLHESFSLKPIIKNADPMINGKVFFKTAKSMPSFFENVELNIFICF
jgi:hypothetical protein